MVTLYHVRSSRSDRSLWLLHELGIPFRVVPLAFRMDSLRSPEYLAIHPLGRVPCIVDDERTLFESGAIAQYLCQRHDPDGLGRRPEHPEWPEWLQWIHFSETIAVHASYLVQQENFVAPADRSAAVVDLETRRLKKTLQVVDRHLRQRFFMLPAGFSAADIAVGYSIHMAKMFATIDGLDAVDAYYDRMRARPGFAAALAPPAEGTPA